MNLTDYKLVYLATPYSKYPKGIHFAAEHAAMIAGNLLLAGVKVYSPIAHTHTIAMASDIDPLDHSIWIPFDHAMMDASEALLICTTMDGWDTSYGIGEEIKYFRKQGKPILEWHGGEGWKWYNGGHDVDRKAA